MQSIKAIKINWREWVLLAFALLLTFARAFTDWLGGYYGVTEQLSVASNFLAGVSKFGGAHAVAIVGMMLWPSLNRFLNEGFNPTWKVLDDKQKLDRVILVLLAEGLYGTICFASTT